MEPRQAIDTKFSSGAKTETPAKNNETTDRVGNALGVPLSSSVCVSHASDVEQTRVPSYVTPQKMTNPASIQIQTRNLPSQALRFEAALVQGSRFISDQYVNQSDKVLNKARDCLRRCLTTTERTHESKASAEKNENERKDLPSFIE
jgi:hypothetical protein